MKTANELTFVTGNSDKFINAFRTATNYGIALLQTSPDIDEVQGEDAEYIARKKSQAAYDLLGKSLFISDDSWAITGLNGFPGAYMKSVNQWFSVEDFLRLTSHLTDRSCVLSQIVVYQDETGQKLFSNAVKGTILTEPSGEIISPWTALVTMDGDDGLTIAEMRHQFVDRSDRAAADIWRQLFDWYKERTV